jgi:2-dehydropantoate 2-reductase
MRLQREEFESMNDDADGARVWKVLVVGIGGVGGYFGGLLARHYRESEGKEDRGKTVTTAFVARGDHLRAIRENGLILNTARQSGLVCRPDQATDAIEQPEAPDLCLVCVKGYDLDEVSRQLAPLVSEAAVVMPLLNGVDIRERIRRHVKSGVVLPACVYVSASIDRPGVVTQKGMAGLLICGRDPDRSEYDPSPVVHLFEQAGVSVDYEEDAYPAIWEKYLFIASFGLVTAWADKPFGAVLQDTELYGLVRRIMEEIEAVSAKRGVALGEGIIESSLNKAENFPFETKTSYQRDVEKNARNEGELFGGTILRLGRELGVPTPATQRLYREIEDRLLGSGQRPGPS